MMFRKGSYPYSEEETHQALEIPYAGNRLSLVVFLPRKPDGLLEMEKSFTLETVERGMQNVRSTEVDLYLPRFEVTYETDLTPLLKTMGMKRAFDPSQADFTGMTPKKDLFISHVVQKAFVELNEKGTEAAAATGVAMRLTAFKPPITFRADHPFLFLIRDRHSGMILFMGRVVRPQ
jgi:serpin B